MRIDLMTSVADIIPLVLVDKQALFSRHCFSSFWLNSLYLLYHAIMAVVVVQVVFLIATVYCNLCSYLLCCGNNTARLTQSHLFIIHPLFDDNLKLCLHILTVELFFTNDDRLLAMILCVLAVPAQAINASGWTISLHDQADCVCCAPRGMWDVACNLVRRTNARVVQ